MAQNLAPYSRHLSHPLQLYMGLIDDPKPKICLIEMIYWQSSPGGAEYWWLSIAQNYTHSSEEDDRIVESKHITSTFLKAFHNARSISMMTFFITT